jgi:nucleotide-binding universal stress UspA family protein
MIRLGCTTPSAIVETARERGIVEESQQHDLLFIGATGEGLFEQRLLGSIPEHVAREAVTTVTMTKRCWRLKSFLSRMQVRY